MNPTYVDHFSYALGDRISSVEDSAISGRTISSASLLRDAGFERHHMCHQGDSAYSLAQRAVAGIEERLSDIGAIVYATCLPCNGNMGREDSFRATRDVKHLMDFPASHLQTDFNLHAAQVFGLNQQACTGMLGSIRLASLMLSAEPELGQVLCVTADRFPEGAVYEQAYNLISDGAAACLVSAKPLAFKVVGYHGVTNGAMSLASDDETVGCFFNYSHSAISATLKKSGLSIEDIDWIVPQNTNKKAWQILASLLHFDPEKVFFPSLDEVGHLISGDNLINLKTLLEHGHVRRGERVLLFMAGYGLNWQCTILEKVGDDE